MKKNIKEEEILAVMEDRQWHSPHSIAKLLRDAEPPGLDPLWVSRHELSKGLEDGTKVYLHRLKPVLKKLCRSGALYKKMLGKEALYQRVELNMPKELAQRVNRQERCTKFGVSIAHIYRALNGHHNVSQEDLLKEIDKYWDDVDGLVAATAAAFANDKRTSEKKGEKFGKMSDEEKKIFAKRRMLIIILHRSKLIESTKRVTYSLKSVTQKD